MTYQIDGNCGIVTIAGDTESPDGLDRLIAEILVQPNFRLGFGFLRDRRGLPPPAPGIVRRRVEAFHYLGTLPKTRWALLVEPTELKLYGLQRPGPIMADGGAEVSVFTDLGAATIWLSSLPKPPSQNPEMPQSATGDG